MSDRTIWYEVFDLKHPAAEPFVVLRIDTSVHRNGEVVSLHWNRDEAKAHAEALSALSPADGKTP